MSESNEIERCGFLFVHEDAVEQVLGEMPGDETLYDLAELFKVFGDSTRIKILTPCLRRNCAYATSPDCWASPSPPCPTSFGC